MLKKSITYLVLFYSMYFMGHFSMSMAYRLGLTATVACGIISCAAIIFTFWKAAGRSEGRKEIDYGIVSGFFIWCFFGEFLEHEEIMAIAAIEALPALAAYMLIASLIVYRRYFPIGTRFALGHFGCVWLLHFILVNQTEVLQVKHPEAFTISIILTGIVFLLAALFLFYKLFGERSERAFVAYLLLTFIFFWATVETLQVMHIVPDYTYYPYWTKKLSPGSRTSTATQYFDRNQIDTLCSSRKGTFIPVIQKGAPCRSVQALEPAKTGEEVMEEGFVSTTVDTFKYLLTKYVQQFKEEKVMDRDYSKPEFGSLPAVPVFDRVRDKITFVREYYDWENEATRELASYLLERFPSLLLPGDLIKRVNKKMEEENGNTVDEALLFQAMEETFLVTATVTSDNLKISGAQQSK